MSHANSASKKYPTISLTCLCGSVGDPHTTVCMLSQERHQTEDVRAEADGMSIDAVEREALAEPRDPPLRALRGFVQCVTLKLFCEEIRSDVDEAVEVAGALPDASNP